MATLADGPLVIAIDQVRLLLGDSYWWQNLDTDAVRTPAEALAAIYIDALPKHPGGNETYTRAELETLRPYAIIEQAPDDGFQIEVHTASTSCAVPRGHIALGLRLTVPESMDEHTLGGYVAKTVGRIVQTGDLTKPGLLDLGVPPLRLAIRRLAVGAYYRIPEEYVESEGDFIGVEIDIWWGPS